MRALSSALDLPEDKDDKAGAGEDGGSGAAPRTPAQTPPKEDVLQSV